MEQKLTFTFKDKEEMFAWIQNNCEWYDGIVVCDYAEADGGLEAVEKLGFTEWLNTDEDEEPQPGDRNINTDPEARWLAAGGTSKGWINAGKPTKAEWDKVYEAEKLIKKDDLPYRNQFGSEDEDDDEFNESDEGDEAPSWSEATKEPPTWDSIDESK